ncbi:MAG: hypothetical protein LJE84_03510 [Gammaproteobacteria bacterium]|nr:hypothetical protein [Gammaproteobacteria bacterium]
MKCYTVTANGVSEGIDLASEPYPHVAVGDPAAPHHFRRVEVDEGLAGNGKVMNCSVVLDVKEEDPRRASYKLVEATGEDDDQALVKIEPRATDAGRSFYELPANTFSLAVGWFSGSQGNKVNSPVELVVLKKDTEIPIFQTEDMWKDPEPVLTVRFDGNRLS